MAKRQPKTLKHMAMALEENDLFKEEIARLSKKGKVTESDYKKLREDLEKLGFPKLTEQWDFWFRIKVMNPKFEISEHTAGGAVMLQQIDENNKPYHEIRVYPNETTLDDVKRAYGKIIKKYKRKPFRNIDYFELGKYIDKLKETDKLSHKQIADKLSEEGRYSNCSYTDSIRILNRYREKTKNK